MNWTRLVLAAVVGAVILVLVGTIWHLLLFPGLVLEVRAGLARPEPWVPVAVLGEVLRAVVLAYIYPFGYQGGEPWKEGLRFGIAMGVFSGMITLLYTGALNVAGFGWFWLDLAYFVIQGAIGGIGIALVYGKSGAKAG
jgi:hypothetical protein